MKVISYSLFGDTKSFEFPFYLRGLYFNLRMNKLIYPDWFTVVHVSKSVYDEHALLFNEMLNMFSNFNMYMEEEQPLCKAMLWRMHPVFSGFATHVICRDADAITNYKEAQAVQEWVDSGLGFHGITDNPAHTLPMMGGMIGFKVDQFKQLFPQWKTFDDMTIRFNLSQHGSDQQLIMADIYPKAKGHMMGHFFEGCKEQVKITEHWVTSHVQGISPKLWESNLTCRHIGSPGVVDFETLRFFKRFDKKDYSEFERKYSDIFYWTK